MKQFILSLLFLFQFNLFSQQAASNNMSVAPSYNSAAIETANNITMNEIRYTGNVRFDDIQYEYLLDPATQIIKSGYIKREGLKGIIFTDINHHSIFASKVRKQIFSLFEKSDYVTNKKKWKTKDGYSKDNIYVSINSSYIDEYQDFNAYWIFKDHNQEVILSFKATNKDFHLVLNELNLLKQ